MAAADQLTQKTISFGQAEPRSSFLSGRLIARQVQQRGQTLQKRGKLRTEAAFGGTRTKAPSQAYICKDCGYIYDGRQSFEDLDKSYACPVCNAPKRRFAKYNQPVQKGANNTSTRKERKAELQSGGGGLNPGIVIGVAAALAIGAVVYINATF